MNVMTKGNELMYKKIVAVLEKYELFKNDVADANDCLNVFIDNVPYCFFVDHTKYITDEIDVVFDEIEKIINDGFTKWDMFFDYGLKYEGDIIL